MSQTSAFMIGAAAVGFSFGALVWELFIAEPLRRRIARLHRFL